MGELADLLSRGYREVMIAGINIGQYSSGGYHLADLLTELDAVRELDGIHLCSLEPISLDEKLIERLPALRKLRPHFHVSIQSGCDRTLSRMNRMYSFERYLALITRIREAVRGAAVSTDVIAGFPGESGDDFLESCENIARCRFSDIHVFKYSPRDGTAAAAMPNRLSPHRVAERANVLEGIRMQACHDFNSRFVGAVEKILILKRRSAVLAEGVNTHEIKTAVTGPAMSAGDYADALITGLGKGCGSLLGEAR
jgi:threonylcarbamoyladenosine tRNA methylthiotransferase MtaB